MFSKSCEYGIKASVFIAQQSLKGERVSLNDIAEAIDSPTAFTAKTLQLLSKNGIIKSIKGFAGGYAIPTENLDTLSLFHIVDAIDGDPVYKACGLGLKECNEAMPCPIHNDFKKVRSALKKILENTLIKKLANDLDGGLVYLKRIMEN
ncbi:Rrf2 family transcriptional regulator [Flammeovirgaceae bacterium SG7u.111]|nr:Rrf2 family transcriptional regulator [Flammeovirgaceae bacterium SG7u.132]WPO33464.1 Rrf2 family transcriptional regulator [Flammeovirgaceae bacterium SG7u.111]